MAASWTYADYLIKPTKAERLTALKQHILEVSQALAAPISQSIDGMGYTKSQLQAYLEYLRRELSSFNPMFARARVRDNG